MLTKIQLRPDSYSAANKLFGQGVDNFTGAMNKYSNRLKNRAVNELLGGYTPNTDDPMAGRNDLVQQLSQVGGISPAEALGLADKASNLAYMKGQFGVSTDDLGNVYKFNKNTGEVETVAGGYDIYNSPKNTVLKPVTNRDPYGVETTTQVPINKLTGQPVDTYDFSGPSAGYENPEGVRVDGSGRPLANQPTAVSTKYPTLDKGTREGADALGASLNLMDNITVPTDSQSGPIDSRIDDAMSWLNVDTDDAVASKNFDAEVANLTTAFGTAQVKGVLSDKDTKFITDQMPDRRLSPAVNANRIKSIKKKIRESIDRFNKANPYHQIDVNSTESTTTNTGGSSYGAGTEIISF